MLIGQSIGPFAITGELGSGAMGTVYRATLRKEDGRDVPVALKVISLALIGNDAALARFEREASILQQLRHPHIVRRIGTGVHKPSKTRFIAMEFIDGEDLGMVLKRRNRVGWEDVAVWGAQLCDALQHAHDKGIIHRDLKPSNLMLTRDGQLKLTDFGIAKDTDVTALTGANSTIGTAAYMSPEQCKGDRNLTTKSDLYSLGVVLYELLTGVKPFTADTPVEVFIKHVGETPTRPSKLVPDLPVWLDNLVMFLLEKDKEHRPLDAATVGRLLGEIADKVRAQQSVGSEVAHSRRADRPTTRVALDSTDLDAARSLRGKKRRKKAKLAWYRAGWVAAVGVAAIVGGGAYLVWSAVKPPGADLLYQQYERADGDEKRATAAAFLKAVGAADDPRAATVRAGFQAEAVRRAEAVLQRRFQGKLRDNSEGYDESEYRIAVRAQDAEKDGRPAEAADLWAALRAKAPAADMARLADPAESDRAVLGWLAAKRERDIRQGLPELEQRLMTQLRDDRLAEFGRPLDPISPEATALKALRLEEYGDRGKARETWARLAGDTERDPAQRLWFLLGASKARPAKGKAADPPEFDRLKKLQDALAGLEAEAGPAVADPEARVARRTVRNGCRDIVALYEDDTSEPVKAVVAAARKLLVSIPK